jgi:hypothetical protein
MTVDMTNTTRRFISAAGASTAAALFSPQKVAAEVVGRMPGDQTPQTNLSKMNISKSDTAVVFIDPQNDVPSEKGLSWSLLHESLKENNTIENMETHLQDRESPRI